MTMPGNGDPKQPPANDVAGYQRATCPQCITTYLYPDDADWLPMCGRCGLRMQREEASGE